MEQSKKIGWSLLLVFGLMAVSGISQASASKKSKTKEQASKVEKANEAEENIIPNGDFEDGNEDGSLPEFWQFLKASGAEGTISWENSGAFSAKYCVKLIKNNSATYCRLQTIGKKITPITGVPYIFQCQIKGSAGKMAFIAITTYDKSTPRKFVGAFTLNLKIIQDNKWELMEKELIFKEDVDMVMVELRVMAQDETVSYDNVSLRKKK